MQSKNASLARSTLDKERKLLQPTDRRAHKADRLQTVAIRRRLQMHARNCTYFSFSGDRHCSCGRDQALQELEAIERALGAEHDRKC